MTRRRRRSPRREPAVTSPDASRPRRRVVVTRPAAQAGDWLARLHEAGFEALALPLLSIDPPADAAPVQQAWQRLAHYGLVFFVSPNAAEHFHALRPRSPDGEPSRWPPTTRAAAPGPGTGEVLVQHGVPMTQIVTPSSEAEHYDSESLWERLRGDDWRGTTVLFVRGEAGRDFLAERLRVAGAQVDFVTAYRRGAPSLGAADRAALAALLSAPESVLWWFSSSEAIGHLASLAPPGTDWSRAAALATHPRIAERARRLGFGRVDESSPAVPAVLSALRRSIESFAT